MSKHKSYLIMVSLFLFLVSCSNQEELSESADRPSQSANEATSDSKELVQSEKKNGLSEFDQGTTANVGKNAKNKMMIYQATIDLETSDYDQFYQTLEKRINQQEAYIVETNIHKTDRGNRRGHIRLRVPQANFQTLLTGVQQDSDQVISRNVSGRDVTKDYVDLESRLEAKEKIESRLLNFLEQAEATEDLIKISQDLERVQEEIEVLKGEMKYLENQSDYSTITLSIKETKVVVPGMENQQLNTWEKTKQAFMNSINHITSFFSWIIVFFLGFSPVLLLIAAFLLIIWRVRKKQKQSSNE